MKGTITIKIYNVMLWILFFAVYEPVLFENKQLITIIRGSNFIIVFLFLFSTLGIRKLINGAVPFCLLIIASGIYNMVIGTQGYSNILISSIIYAIGIFELYTLFAYYYYYNHMKELFECLYRIIMFYCMGSIISMILLGHSSQGTEITYLWGNKFTTSYLFMVFLALYLNKYWYKIQKYYRYKIIYFILVIVLIFVNMWLYCTTTVVASFIFLIALLLPEKIQDMLVKPKIIIIAIIASALFVVLYDWILSNSIIQYLVKQVLGESLTLTGRVRIYLKLLGIISNNMVLGYGYGNNIIELVVGYGNAQNGLMQLIVNYGFAGMIGFLCLVYKCFQYEESAQKILPIYLLVYALIISALVEISFNSLFFMMIFLIYWHGKECLKSRTYKILRENR